MGDACLLGATRHMTIVALASYGRARPSASWGRVFEKPVIRLLPEAPTQRAMELLASWHHSNRHNFGHNDKDERA